MCVYMLHMCLLVTSVSLTALMILVNVQLLLNVRMSLYLSVIVSIC